VEVAVLGSDATDDGAEDDVARGDDEGRREDQDGDSGKSKGETRRGRIRSAG
jgi:hypothetical protein